MNFVSYKRGKTGKTGRLITKELHCVSQRSIERDLINPRAITKVIRWGSTTLWAPCFEDELNCVAAIENASNKLKALNIMKEAGVSVPWFTNNKEKAKDKVSSINYGNMVGRTTYHQGGSNFEICVDKTDVSSDYQSSHWLELIPIHKEWRVHVFQGEVIGVSRKTDEDVGYRITNRYTRNHANGWRFIRCDLDRVQPRLKELGIEAVKSLGLDFGAVDIILSDGTESTSEGDRKYYVLEVNSAPSVEKGSTILYEYIRRFKEWLRKS